MKSATVAKLCYYGRVLMSSHYSRLIAFIVGLVIGYYCNTAIRYVRVGYSVYARQQQVKKAEHAAKAAAGQGLPGIHDSACGGNTAYRLVGMCPGITSKGQLSEDATVNKLQVFVNFTIPTDGVLAGWRFFQSTPTSSIVFFVAVVRIDEGRLMIVGRNRLTSSNNEGWVERIIESKDRLVVKKNDFIAMVYDSLEDDPVVGAVDASTKPHGIALSDGVEIDFDATQVESLVPIGEKTFLTVEEMIASKEFEIRRQWRLPALQAIILKT